MSFSNLFKWTNKDGLVLHEQVYATEEYRKLIKRDKGCPGDSEGRNKLQTCKELVFAFHLVHPASSLNAIPYAERKKQAAAIAGIEPDISKDKLLLKAIDRMKQDIILSPLGKAYYAAERSFYSAAEDIEYQQNEIDNLKVMIRTWKQDVEIIGEPDKEQVGKVKEYINLLSKLSDMQSDIASNIEKLPKLKSVLDGLAAKFAEEGGGKLVKVGGREIGNREIPTS